MPDIPELLLTLQSIDTDLDQLTTRRARLPERDEAAAASEAIADWQHKVDTKRARIDELEAAIADAERQNGVAEADKARLEGQLKTVIAPREAEALMHEIETVVTRRDALDIAEIEALEEQATLDDDVTALLGQESALHERHEVADGALAEVVAALGTAEQELTEGRVAAREVLSEQVLTRYDRVRAQQGVAVARLNYHRCEGCHLDLSAAEVDDVKEEAAASGVTECPQCGRMLVV